MKTKAILKFLRVFLVSLAVTEGIEWAAYRFLHFDVHYLKLGWLGMMIIWGFKFHIFCCLIPAVWASYKCRHKKCEHEHCEHGDK